MAGMEHRICDPHPTNFAKFSFINYHRKIHIPIDREKMASVFRYISNALDDFVLFAAADPLSALTVVYLGLTLVFASVWASWVVELQQYATPNLQNQVESPSSDGGFFDADERYDAGVNLGVITLPKVIPAPGATPSAAIQESNIGLGLPTKWPEQSRVGSSPLQPSPLRNSVSADSQSDADTVAGFTAGSFSVRSSRDGSGEVVLSPPARRSSYVCFYPSSSPCQRGVVTLSPDGFGRRHGVYDVLPARQHDLCRESLKSPKSLSNISSPSEGSQSISDIQSLDDQARAELVQVRAQDAQVKANIKLLEAELRMDKQRIDAHHRAELRRLENETEEISRDMGAINWNL